MDSGNDETRMTGPEKRLVHVRELLEASRSTLRLLVLEEDPLALAQKCCRLLADIPGYLCAWILLKSDGEEDLNGLAGAGCRRGFIEKLGNATAVELPLCLRQASDKGDLFILPEGDENCEACALAGLCPGGTVLRSPIRSEGRSFGFLLVHLADDVAAEEEDREFCGSIALDLGLMLKRIGTDRHNSSEQKMLRELFQDSRDGVVVVNPDGRIVNASQAYCEMLGHSMDELRSFKDFYQITHEPWREWEAREIFQERLMERGYSGLFEKEYIRKDGTIFPVELRVYSVKNRSGEIEYFWAIVRDITERKKNERELIRLKERAEESMLKYKAIADSAPLAVFISKGSEQKAEYINSMFCRLFGFTLEEVPSMGHLWEKALPDLKYRERVERQWKRRVTEAIESRTEIEPLEMTMSCKDGSLKQILWSFTSTGQENWAFGLDLTEFRRAEEALRDSEERYRLLSDVSMEGILLHHDGVVLDLNPSLAKMMRYSREELIGENFLAFVSEEDREQIRRNLLKEYAPPYVVRMARKNGESFFAEIESRNFQKRGEVLRVSSIRDISERKILEDQFRHAQKMESVGRLAGGVAHDFNNMLGVIMGYAELAMERIDPLDPLYKDLLEIRNAGQRSIDITRQLLTFARRQAIAPQVLQLNDTIEGLLKMLRRLLGEDIDLVWKPAEDLWPVMMDPSQLDQILANLCVNARDAISGIGRLIIETGKVVFDRVYCSDHPGAVPGEYTMFAVSDNGIGMDRETLEKLFEPFFTTKEPGRGTGLGLATVYGIVKQNNGYIAVYSEPGLGSTFKIYLPGLIGENVLPKDREETEIPPGRGETILVVEDDIPILMMSMTILKKLGYKVLGAGTKKEALKLAGEGGVDLLLSDVIMPDINGKHLAALVTKIQPGVRVLFMSGYTADVIASQGILEEGVNFIQKPFTMKDIALKLRRILE